MDDNKSIPQQMQEIDNLIYPYGDSPHKETIEEMAKPKCKLTGLDSNVYVIIGAVQKALKKAGLREKADEFFKKATNANSYDEVLGMTHDYVTVE